MCKMYVMVRWQEMALDEFLAHLRNSKSILAREMRLGGQAKPIKAGLTWSEFPQSRSLPNHPHLKQPFSTLPLPSLTS